MRHMGITVGLVASLGLVLVVACGGPPPIPTPVLRDVIIRELATKHEATTGWEENVTFTLQAQRQLIGGKPTLFRVYVDDVFERRGKLFVRLSSSGSVPGYVLELECSRLLCSPSIMETIIAGKPFSEYAVVANIQEVSRAAFALRASPLSEDEAEIVVDALYTTFIARGICIDMAYIGAD